MSLSGLPDINALYSAYDFFNKRLFENTLQTPIITIHRHAGAYGYFWTDKFSGRQNGDLKNHELAVNPDTMQGRSDKEILSTLVHEMAHLWQADHGKPSRNGYHNKQWADKMEFIGLMPSDTGVPEGKTTGQKMTHYIVDGGFFDIACNDLLASGWALCWESTPVETRRVNNDKVKYSCVHCGVNAWGKAGITLLCGDCGISAWAKVNVSLICGKCGQAMTER